MSTEFQALPTYKPYSIESEQAVVGGILIDNNRVNEVSDIISAKDFYSPQNAIIFAAIETLVYSNQPCDVVTVLTALENTGKLEEAGGMAYLAELAESTPSAANILAYARTVATKSRERKILEISRGMNDAIYDEDADSEEKINNALSLVNSFDAKEEKEKTFLELNQELGILLNQRAENKGGLTGVSSGFEAIDKRFNGLQKTDLIVLAGRPGSGKTTLALNIARNVSQDRPVMVFSMEMSGVQLTEKIWASYGVRLESIKKADFSDADEGSRIQVAVSKARELNIAIDERGALTPEQVRARCLREQRKQGPLGLVVIDYLQLMRVNKSVSRTEDTTKISGALKALAKELDCPVIALSQLNRGVESRNNKRPVLSDLRDSGSIEQDADIIMFIYRDDYYAAQEGRKSNAVNIAEVNTAKFRAGEVGLDVLSTELQYSRFTDFNDSLSYYEEVEEKPSFKDSY